MFYKVTELLFKCSTVRGWIESIFVHRLFGKMSSRRKVTITEELREKTHNNVHFQPLRKNTYTHTHNYIYKCYIFICTYVCVYHILNLTNIVSL